MNNKNKAQVHTVQERDYCNTVIYCSEYRRHLLDFANPTRATTAIVSSYTLHRVQYFKTQGTDDGNLERSRNAAIF